MKIIDKIKHTVRNYYVLYADKAELLIKAEKLLRPLPEGCELVKLTYENQKKYKCKYLVDKMLQIGDEVYAIVNKDNEIIAWHYGTYRCNTSMFFKVRKCDFEHVEILVDERYRRKGIALHLLYHTVKNLKPEYIKNNKLGTVIRPDNIPSLKLHEDIGFKKSHRIIFFHLCTKKIDGQWKLINIPHYSI